MTVHLLLSAGRGPQECAWALARLVQRLEADAARHDLEIRRIESVRGDRRIFCGSASSMSFRRCRRDEPSSPAPAYRQSLLRWDA